MLLVKILLPQLGNILLVSAFDLNIVGQCGRNVFCGENVGSRERTEDVQLRKEDIPVVECERENTHIVSAVTPIKHAFRLAVRVATDRYPTSVPATALRLSDCGVWPNCVTL